MPPLIERFETFYIEYETDGATSIDATVWEVAEWAPDGKPVFYNAGPRAPGTNPKEIDPVFSVRIGWDGCSHVRNLNYHFDELEEWDNLSRCIRYLYDDVCERHGVVDGPL